jgi:hypothetical protein
MNCPLPHQVVSSLPAFASYRRELAEWLARDTVDNEELHRRSTELCAEAHAAGVPAEQILVALRASGIKPRWTIDTLDGPEEPAVHRYTSAMTLLLQCFFEGSRSEKSSVAGGSSQ